MPSMSDHIAEYKKEIAGVAIIAALALLGPCGPKGCDSVTNSIKSHKDCIENILCPPKKKTSTKKTDLKTSPTSTIPIPAKHKPKHKATHSIKPKDNLEKKIVSSTTSSTPEHKGYTILIKDFTKNPSGTLRTISNATPKDLYEWMQSSAGGIYFKDVKKLDLKFNNYQNKSVDLIAGKPLQSIENGGHLYHTDNCDGKEYSFILDRKENEDADKLSQEDFTKLLEKYESAVIAKKDRKAIAFFGADASEVHARKVSDLFSSHYEIVVGACQQPAYSGAGAYLQNQNPIIIYQDRLVGPTHGFPGAVPMRGDGPSRPGGPERRR